MDGSAPAFDSRGVLRGYSVDGGHDGGEEKARWSEAGQGYLDRRVGCCAVVRCPRKGLKGFAAEAYVQTGIRGHVPRLSPRLV